MNVGMFVTVKMLTSNGWQVIESGIFPNKYAVWQRDNIRIIVRDGYITQMWKCVQKF